MKTCKNEGASMDVMLHVCKIFDWNVVDIMDETKE